MNRKARKMNKQYKAGKPTTGRPWPCGIIVGAAGLGLATLITGLSWLLS